MADRSRPKRIAVLGRSGSGKSTTAIALGDALDLPVIHLDELYWTSDWRPVAAARFEARIAEAVAGETWVVDGGYMSSPSFGSRIRGADVVVITHASLARCMYRVIRRTIDHRGRPRVGRPVGADERFSIPFLIWVVRWTWKHRDLVGEVRAYAPDVPIVVIRNPRDLEGFLAGG